MAEVSEFIRKKGSVVSEVSVHDSRIEKLKLKGDELTIMLDRCSVCIGDDERSECRPAFIRLQKFDNDEFMSNCRIIGKRKYRKISFGKFAKMLKSGNIRDVEIIDVFYRNIDIMLVGVLRKNKKWKEFQLRLSYLGDMVFGYELPWKSP